MFQLKQAACCNILFVSIFHMGFPGGTVLKNLPATVGDERDTASIPGLGSYTRAGNAKPLQYSCLKNPMDRGA